MVIIQVRVSWRIRYVSAPAFEEEGRTTFETLDHALAAIRELLPRVNAPEARARRELEQRPSD